MKKLFTLLLTCMIGTMTSWAEDWTTVWSTDFASAPTGMTYSVSNGSTNISNGYLEYHQGGGSGNRALTTTFTDSKFAVDTNWKMEFDWNSSSANQNSSNVAFATNNGTAFTLTWASYATAAVVTDASSTQLSTTLPILGYNKATCSDWSHITITGDTENGIYLTITKGETTYVNNVLVTSTFGYPSTFSGSLGRAVSHMYIDNITFSTPKVAGFVAAPTGTITAPDGSARKFTLSCQTDGATIYYSESDLEIGADGWYTYTSEVTTSAETIYTYASDGTTNSEKNSFATGAGTIITLNAPAITLSGISATNDTYYPIVTITNDQSNLSLVPTSTTLTYKLNNNTIPTGSPYTFTETGELTVTVSADGYASNSASYTVNTGYIKTKTIDFAAITENDLSSVWTKTSDASQLPATNWINRYSSDEFPVYIYDYRNENANTTDVIEGLIVNISASTADPGITPNLYMGAGLILPSMKVNASDLSASSSWNSNIGISVNGGTANQIAVYTYPTNYGQTTNTAIKAANDTYPLYRFSDMLTKVEIYTPAEQITINSTGVSSYVTTYALNFSEVEGLTALVATEETQTEIKMEKVTEVPAGTPIIVRGTPGEIYTVPAGTCTELAKTNLLKGFINQEFNVGTDATNTVYALKNTDGDFHKVATTVTIPAKIAFLESQFAATTEAKAMTIVGEEEYTTAITITTESEAKQPAKFYNAAGQQVGANYNGIVIDENGNKYIK